MPKATCERGVKNTGQIILTTGARAQAREPGGVRRSSVQAWQRIWDNIRWIKIWIKIMRSALELYIALGFAHMHSIVNAYGLIWNLSPDPTTNALGVWGVTSPVGSGVKSEITMASALAGGAWPLSPDPIVSSRDWPNQRNWIWGQAQWLAVNRSRS